MRWIASGNATGWRATAIAENRHHLALNLPLAIPLASGNVNGIKFGVRRLQANAIMFLFLVETLERRATARSLLQVNRDNDITAFATGLWLHHDIIAIADVIFDHRTSFDDQGIVILLLQFASHVDALIRVGENVEGFAGGNRSHHRHTSHRFCQLNAATLLLLSADESLLFKHGEMIVDMAGAGDVHFTANLAICRRHPFRPYVVDDELIHPALNIAGLFASHRLSTAFLTARLPDCQTARLLAVWPSDFQLFDCPTFLDMSVLRGGFL